jgi:coatomer subunit beta
MELVEDFVDDIEKICQTDSDLSTKRNAFVLLFQMDQVRALNYLKTIMGNAEDDPIHEMGDVFQLAILDMLRKLCKVEPTQKQRLMSAIFMLSNSKSASVLLECADTIVQLTTAPTAIKIAIQSYLSLLNE